MASTSARRHETYESTRASAKEGEGASALDSVAVKGITIAGWTVETQRGSIADSKTIDEYSSRWGIPLPEMPFDKNRLILRHEASGWSYLFDAAEALRSVEGVDEKAHLPGRCPPKTSKSVFGQKPGKSRRVKVAHAGEWGKKRCVSGLTKSAYAPLTLQRAVESREQQQQQQQQPVSMSATASNFGSDVAAAAANGSIGDARDYDWTYSCTWPGVEVGGPSQMTAAQDPARDRIPVERLGPPTRPGAKPEPILFYDDLVLFEDELADNGSSMLGVKVRVMPSGFLVLQRFFLRVDNVVFRLFDTRMYVGFDDERPSSAVGAVASAMASLSLDPSQSLPVRVIRECSGCQAKYSQVKARLPPYKPNDLSPLTDPGWVSMQLGKMQEKQRRRPVQDITQPAVLPSTIAPGQESNRILGEVIDDSEEDDKWEGEGQWVDVVVLQGERK